MEQRIYDCAIPQRILRQGADCMKKLKLVGVDYWSRPVYEDDNGNYWKDVNLGSGTTAKKATRKSPAKSPKGGGVGDGANLKTCDCPLCGQDFIVADGYSPAEHLTKGLITVFSEMQLKAEQDISIENPLPCPRCGQYRMLPKVHRNSLSRHEQIYVCPICGTDEAVRVHSNKIAFVLI